MSNYDGKMSKSFLYLTTKTGKSFTIHSTISSRALSAAKPVFWVTIIDVHSGKRNIKKLFNLHGFYNILRNTFVGDFPTMKKIMQDYSDHEEDMIKRGWEFDYEMDIRMN